MSVVLDPDWDNKAIIIDNSASKKRKQQSIEKYAQFNVEEKKREEEAGGWTQSPRAGTVEHNACSLGRVLSIVPRVELNTNQPPTLSKRKPTVLAELKQPVLGGTVVKVQNYKKHYVDPEYVAVQHQKLIGMMKQWRMLVLDIIKEMEDEWEFSWFAFKEQHNWAKTCLDPVMMGISKFNMVFIGLLNIEAVIELVDGVDTEEKADFIIKLAKCKSCEIALIRHNHLNNCTVVTIFDDDTKHKIAYGKKEIKDYSMPKNKEKKSRYIVNK